MFKVFLKKSIMILIAVALVGGVLIATLPLFSNVSATNGKPKAANTKENDIKEVTSFSPNTNKKGDDKESDSLSIQKNSNDNSQNKSDNTKKQETTSSKLEKSNNNDTSKKTVASSQTKNTNIKPTTNTQNNTNSTSSIKKPALYYDRTTSVYANDNITLLRVEYYKNNKLVYYSVVEQYNDDTKSYIEKIYQCNSETNIDPLIRTDVYSNGNLIK